MAYLTRSAQNEAQRAQEKQEQKYAGMVKANCEFLILKLQIVLANKNSPGGLIELLDLSNKLRKTDKTDEIELIFEKLCGIAKQNGISYTFQEKIPQETGRIQAYASPAEKGGFGGLLESAGLLPANEKKTLAKIPEGCGYWDTSAGMWVKVENGDITGKEMMEKLAKLELILVIRPASGGEPALGIRAAMDKEGNVSYCGLCEYDGTFQNRKTVVGRVLVLYNAQTEKDAIAKVKESVIVDKQRSADGNWVCLVMKEDNKVDLYG